MRGGDHASLDILKHLCDDLRPEGVVHVQYGVCGRKFIVQHVHAVHFQRGALLSGRPVSLEVALCDGTEVFGPFDSNDPGEREVRGAQKRSALAAPEVDENEVAVIDPEVAEDVPQDLWVGRYGLNYLPGRGLLVVPHRQDPAGVGPVFQVELVISRPRQEMDQALSERVPETEHPVVRADRRKFFPCNALH